MATSATPAIGIDGSAKVVSTPVPTGETPRDWYLEHPEAVEGPWISSSDFVPPAFIAHLMRNKKELALGVKFTRRGLGPLDEITNMEGALHTFVVPVMRAYMHGDYTFKSGHSILRWHGLGGGQPARPVIVSALIHPDFEDASVMMRLCGRHAWTTELIKHARKMERRDLASGVLPTYLKQDNLMRNAWDETVQCLIMNGLFEGQDLEEWGRSLYQKPRHSSEAILALENAVRASDDVRQSLKGLMCHLHPNAPTNPANGQPYAISIELLFLIVLHQVRNELLVLEKVCQNQGFVYTFDPPNIFRRALGPDGGELLMLVHAAALKHLARHTRLAGMKVFAYNDFNNPKAMEFMKLALDSRRHIRVVSKKEIFPFNGHYSPLKFTEGAMLVVHNNSDGFGQNIEFERHMGSMDAVIGEFSSAAASLSRDRPDLVGADRLMLHSPSSLHL